MRCDRCGELNPADIHTCSPQELICPKCESEEWDYVEFERGMEDGDKAFYRCFHCQHEWQNK